MPQTPENKVIHSLNQPFIHLAPYPDYIISFHVPIDT